MPELLQPEQERTLERLATEHAEPVIRQRAKLLLMYQAGKPTGDIASSVDLSEQSTADIANLVRSVGVGVRFLLSLRLVDDWERLGDVVHRSADSVAAGDPAEVALNYTYPVHPRGSTGRAEVLERVVIDVSHAHFWDLSAVHALDRVVLKFAREGAEVHVVGMNEASRTLVLQVGKFHRDDVDTEPGH